jgi:phosphoglucosamine mutase
MMKKYFGTDGIRGQVGLDPITPEFILKLGFAVGRVLRGQHATAKALIGKDTRISGYLFESALEAGLCAAGVNINLLGPMPTPAIAYLTRAFRANVGIVISASHNSFQDNGFKFFDTYGAKISDEFELQIEAELSKPLKMVGSSEIGKASRIDDAAGRYIEFCKSTFPTHASLHGLKIVLDCANGATYQVAPHVFSELGASVIDINSSPDGFNINEQCGSTHPEILKKIVVAEQADLGIALDGDGDRVVMVDRFGELIDGDQLIYIIAMQAQKMQRLKGGVVGTEMSNLGLELALNKKKIDFVRARVGDRYVMELLKKFDWQFGAEASGHIVCLNLTTTGDGIVAALQVLAAMVAQEKMLDELHQEWEKMPQTLINIPCVQAKTLLQNDALQKEIKQLELKLKGRGRCLIRASGTEPLIRVMLEGEDLNTIRCDAHDIIERLKAY